MSQEGVYFFRTCGDPRNLTIQKRENMSTFYKKAALICAAAAGSFAKFAAMRRASSRAASRCRAGDPNEQLIGLNYQSKADHL